MISRVARHLVKLRHMTAGEVAARLAEVARRAQEYVAYRRGTAARCAAPGLLRDHGWGQRLFDSATRLVRGGAPGQFARLALERPDLAGRIRRQVRDRAQQLLGGGWRQLGHAHDLRTARNWHVDPVTGFTWPRGFYARIPVYDLPGGVDVKYVWEVNRHQFLADLAAAWVVDRDQACARHVRDLLIDWIEHNPLYEGVNWTSALEAGTRVVSWLWSLAMLADWPGWTDDDRQVLASALEAHGRYLSRHLSYYSSPYNHLMGEATGLYVLGCWLDGLPAASGWRTLGRKVLLQRGPRQFYGDGFCVEQAVGYHFFTLGFLTLACLASRAQRDDLAALEGCLAQAWLAGAALGMPDGRWPAIGDVDSARAFPLHANDFWDFRDLCSLGAVVHRLPALKGVAAGPGPELFWLLGCEGVAAFENLPSEPVRPAVVLRDAGYCIARGRPSDGGDWVLLDCGPVADGLYRDGTPSVAHGHLDALQVLYFRKGTPVLIDSGMPSYAGPLDRLEHFRGPAAHNVFEVQGLPAARHAGRLAWSHVIGEPDLRACLTGSAWLMGGTLRLSGGVRLVRNLLRLPGGQLWIADLAVGHGVRPLHWHWNFPGSGQVKPSVPAVGCLRLNLAHLEVEFCSGGRDLAWHWFCGLEGQHRGWISDGYGESFPATSITLRQEGADPACLLTALGANAPPAAVEIGSLKVCSRGTLPNEVPWLQGGADVVWHVLLDGEWESLACGAGQVASQDGWCDVSGTGDWPCRRRRSEATRKPGAGVRVVSRAE